MTITVSQLYIYPLKSARGVALQSMELDDRGPRGDRRWMIVDGRGRAIAQRALPRVALIAPRLIDAGLGLSAPGMPDLEVPEPEDIPEAEAIEGEVWDGACRVLVADAAAHEWLSTFLGARVRLVHQPDAAVLPIPAQYSGSSASPRRIALTDGSPLLLIGQASLDDLNARLATPVGADRFRPNIIVAGAEPFAEDTWRRITVGSMRFEVTGACARCGATTVDPSTGERGTEPLRTLASYRRSGSNVYFGVDVLHDGSGVVCVGDSVRQTDRMETQEAARREGPSCQPNRLPTGR